MLIKEKTANYSTGFIFLILFCIFRPLTLINANIKIGGLNILEIFAIIISYILLFCIALNFRKIKFDFISVSIIWFCSYCYISILWGSHVRSVTQVTLPFALFFAIRVMVNEPKQIKLLVTIVIIAYCLPLVGSLYDITKGESVYMVESITEIARYSGMFEMLKGLAYSMFFISVYFYIQVIINQLKNRKIKWALLFLLVMSFLCLYKSYVRTAYLGVAFFWFIALYGYNKRYFYIILISSLIIGMLYIGILHQIFFKTQQFDANTASSGRMLLWGHNIKIFLRSNFDRKLLGYGFGGGSTGVFGSENQLWHTHNDYLELLVRAGGIGLLVYLLIHFILLKDVYRSIVAKSTKYFYYGIIFSITIMNFFSGMLLYQVTMSQQFWMIIGFFYVFRDFNATSSINLKNDNLTKSAHERTSGIYT